MERGLPHSDSRPCSSSTGRAYTRATILLRAVRVQECSPTPRPLAWPSRSTLHADCAGSCFLHGHSSLMDGARQAQKQMDGHRDRNKTIWSAPQGIWEEGGGACHRVWCVPCLLPAHPHPLPLQTPAGDNSNNVMWSFMSWPWSQCSNEQAKSYQIRYLQTTVLVAHGQSCWSQCNFWPLYNSFKAQTIQ